MLGALTIWKGCAGVNQSTGRLKKGYKPVKGACPKKATGAKKAKKSKTSATAWRQCEGVNKATGKMKKGFQPNPGGGCPRKAGSKSRKATKTTKAKTSYGVRSRPPMRLSRRRKPSMDMFSRRPRRIEVPEHEIFPAVFDGARMPRRAARRKRLVSFY